MAKLKVIRWSLDGAANEFGINRRTLTQRIKTQGIEPGKDGKFATKQICAAVYGDWDGQRLRKITKEANLLAIDEAERRGELIKKAAVLRAWSATIIELRQKIQNNARLTHDEKVEILRDIREVLESEYHDKQPVTDEEDEA